MRDIILTLIVVGLLPFILRSPRLGAYAWEWISMMNPHAATFGFARSVPFAQMVAVTTLVSFPFSRQRCPFPVSGITVAYVLLMLWMSITCLFALNTPEVVMSRWWFVLKIHVMLLVTMMLIRGREQIERLIWVAVLSIGFFYGVKGGVWTILTGGGSRVYGPPGGMAQDNNAFGLTLVMLMPFFYYLYYVSKRRFVRVGMLCCMVTLAFAILGTQSRGALLALLSMATFLGLKSQRPVVTTALLACGVAAAVLFMPESWSGRMKTMETYEQDSSAMSRIHTWQTMWALALDRPLVGGGFVVDTPQTFAVYAPPGGAGAYQGGKVYVAHSIYFQMLGEHGFPGLFFYLLLGITTWRKATLLSKQTANRPEYNEWVPLLMRMVQVSLVGFAVGGAFLSLAHFDLSYYIMSFVVLVDASLREQDKADHASASSSPLPAISGP